MDVLISAVLGSHGHGFATPESDVDLVQIFAAPTEWVLGLQGVGRESIQNHSEDYDETSYEVRKALTMMFAGSPQMAELLWATDSKVSPHGELLQQNRDKFFPAERVKSAYLGISRNSLDRYVSTGNAKDAKRALYYASHGKEFYLTGNLQVSVPDRSLYDGIENGSQSSTFDLVTRAVLDLDGSSVSPLPQSADKELATELLISIRKDHFEQD